MSKISELGSILGSAIKDEDLFVVVNLEQGVNGTKNITRKELVTAIQQEEFQNINITGGKLSNIDLDITNRHIPNLENNDYFIIKDIGTNTTRKITFEELNLEFANSFSDVKHVYVSSDAATNGNGSQLRPFNNLESAFDYAWQNAPVGITVGPGDYYTNGSLPLPDGCAIESSNGQYVTNIIMNDGYENANAILVGSGCYVRGFAFKNLRVDNFDNPTGGFAIAFRPGAKIMRSPYIRDSSQVSNNFSENIAAPLNPRNSLGTIEDLGDDDFPNKLVGRGGGVILADRAVLDQNSVFTYMLAFGATPRSPNGLGYVAKNGAGINGISSLTIFQRCSFYALNGGQITLNNSGTQFGDISMRSKGFTRVVDPYETTQEMFVSPTVALAIETNKNDIIDDMWNYMQSKGYAINEAATRRDAGYFLDSIKYDFLSGDQTSSRNFIAGFFDYKADYTFDADATIGTESFIYDSAKCARDVGYIVDAIGYDAMFGSNFRSVVAGKAYLRANASKVILGQLEVTLDALEELKTQLIAEANTISSPQSIINSITQNMNIIIDIVGNGESAIPSYILPDPTGFDTGYENAIALIDDNREFITAEVTQYIEDTFNSFAYDVDACERDVGYIIDAMIYDMTYGGNLESIVAGNSYYVGTSLEISSEKTQTIKAYEFMRDLIKDIALNNDVSELQQDVVQVTGTAGSLNASNKAGELVDIVISIINGNITPTVETPDTSWVGTDETDFFDATQTEKENIKDTIIEYVDTSTETFVVNKVKCERDARLITEAIAYDLMFESNHRSITAALAYYRANASEVLNSQRSRTVFALREHKKIVATYLTGSSLTRANSLFDEIITIIQYGPDFASARSYTDPTGYDTGYFNARRLIDSNKTFIQDEVDAWIAYQITNEIAPFDSGFTPFTYDSATCSRDVGLIIDAIGYDLMFGSNFRTITAARSYYRNGAALVTTTQKQATIEAFEKMKELLITLVDGYDAASLQVETLVNVIIDVIEDGLDSIPMKVLPTPTGGVENAFSNEYKYARNLVDENRNFLKAEVVEYIEQYYPSVSSSYDQTACERDIDYILDAVYYDMTYGGNLESVIAGNAYYSGAILQLGSGETEATINSYEYLKEIIQFVSRGVSVPTPLQTVVTQTTNGNAGSIDAATRLGVLIDVVIETIDTGNSQTIVEPDTSWVDTDLSDAHELMQTNKSTIQTGVINYIDQTYVLGYNSEACRRDVGYILDALKYDLTYGGNLETYIAAMAYYIGATAQFGSDEKEVTIAAFERLENILGDIAQGVSITPTSGNTTSQDISGNGGSLAAATFAQDRVGEIITTIDTDGVTLPTKILPNTAWVDAQFINSFNTLNTNIDDIALGVVSFTSRITGNLIATFLEAYDRMRDYIINISNPTTDEILMLDALLNDIIKDTLINPNKLQFGSLIESLGHQFNLAGAGVNRNALPLNFRRVGKPLAASGSVLEEDGGRVRWSGADELNNQYFARGLKINGRTGRLEGRPFTSSVRRLARRAANSRTFT